MHDSIAPLDDEKPKRKFGGKQDGAGRPLGSLNRITKDLKQAILDGCVTCDYAFDPNDPSAPPSISTYMRNVANKHPELFFSAIVRLIPRELHTSLRQDTSVDITYRTMSEVKRAMEAEGMSPQFIASVESLLPVPINDDEEAHEDTEDFERDRS
jgi:hypothetical protein